MELSIEEKAQRYDEAINKLRRFMEQGVDPLITRADVQDFFPELKESEDERIIHWIRKELESKYVVDNIVNSLMADKAFAWLKRQGQVKDSTISQHENKTCKENEDSLTREDDRIRKAIHIYLDWLDGRKDYAPKGVYTIRDMIAWIEKQGDHANFLSKIQVGDKVTRNEDGVLVNLSQLNRVAKKQGEQDEFTKKELECVRGYSKRAIKRLEELKEQSVEQILANSAKPCVDEQKPADKVEQKFEIGDLITNGILVGKIDEIHEWGYHAYFGDHYADVPDVENWHRWTIQDAKDGDVLYSQKGGGVEGIHLIYGWEKIPLTGNTLRSMCTYRMEDNEIIAGGIGAVWWEGVKDKFTPATKKQRYLLFQKMREAGYKWDAEKKELKKIEQNPAWNEEDERMVKVIVAALSLLEEKMEATGSFDREKNWLKDHKDRVQPQTAWKPSEGQMKALANTLKYFKMFNAEGETIDNMIELEEQLKKLKG